MADLVAGGRLSAANEPLSGWLTTSRDALNLRLRRMAVLHPRLQAAEVLSAVTTWLNPLAGWALETQSEALLLAVFDLVILHAARGTLGRDPGLQELLRSLTTPTSLREMAAKAPERIPAGLSNGVERMTTRGPAFVRGMNACAAAAETPDALLAAGALVAWRLGEPRMRHTALRVGATLSNRLGLVALQLEDWPACGWPLAVRALERDAWTHPRALLRPATLSGLEALTDDAPNSDVLTPLMDRIGRRQRARPEAWQKRAPIGDFSGFGGRFAAPPVLVAVADRHTIYAEVHSQVWCVEADLFGARCSPCPLESVPGFGPEAPPPAPPPPALAKDLAHLSTVAKAGGATALLACDGLMAMSLARSHRLQVMVPPTECV